MKKMWSQESGQATLELVVLLIGFIAVFLGLAFVSGLADSDLDILLRARNNAENAAANAVDTQRIGMEFGESQQYRPDIYSQSRELIFSPMEEKLYRSGNTIESFPDAFNTPVNSVPDETSAEYLHQAKLEKWKSFSGIAGNAFRADYVTGLSGENARGTANMVVGSVSGVNAVSTLTRVRNRKALDESFQKFFGVRIRASALENAPGNQVYMPVISESEPVIGGNAGNSLSGESF